LEKAALPSLPNSLGSPPPPRIPSVEYVKAPLTKRKCFSVIFVMPADIFTCSFPPSLPSQLGCGNVQYVPPLLPHPRLPCDTSASPPPFWTLTLMKQHQKKEHPNKHLSTSYNNSLTKKLTTKKKIFPLLAPRSATSTLPPAPLTRSVSRPESRIKRLEN